MAEGNRSEIPGAAELRAFYNQNDGIRQLFFTYFQITYMVFGFRNTDEYKRICKWVACVLGFGYYADRPFEMGHFIRPIYAPDKTEAT